MFVYVSIVLIMAPIATYVFLAMGTDGLPQDGPVDITRISVTVISRADLMNKTASLEVYSFTDVTKIEEYVNNVEKPVCLIAHNGIRFHYPILQKTLSDLEIFLDDDLMCADSLRAFYEITQNPNNLNSADSSNQVKDEILCSTSSVGIKLGIDSGIKMSLEYKKECKQVRSAKTFQQLWKDPFYDPYPNTKRDFNVLDAVYQREVGIISRHSVDDRCVKTAQIALKHGPAFVEWIDNNYCAFADVPANVYRY